MLPSMIDSKKIINSIPIFRDKGIFIANLMRCLSHQVVMKYRLHIKQSLTRCKLKNLRALYKQIFRIKNRPNWKCQGKSRNHNKKNKNEMGLQHRHSAEYQIHYKILDRANIYFQKIKRSIINSEDDFVMIESDILKEVHHHVRLVGPSHKDGRHFNPLSCKNIKPVDMNKKRNLKKMRLSDQNLLVHLQSRNKKPEEHL